MSRAVKTEAAKDGPVKARYEELETLREPFLRRARECAALTIPGLLPRFDDVRGIKLPTPYQMIGAAAVNNISAKLLMALFPPNGQFFRLMITSFDLDKIVEKAALKKAQEDGGDPATIAEKLRNKIEGEAQENLAKIERAVLQEYEANANRATDAEAIKHLVTVGNVLRYCPLDDKRRPRIYNLNHYVVKRDPDGTVLEIITKEGMVPASIPRHVREACDIPNDAEKNLKEIYHLYTRVVRIEDERGKPCWEEYQELNDKEVPASRGRHPLDRCPWLALRWSKIDGEDYGRGHVEDYLGGLISLEGLSKSVLDGAVASSRVLPMVNPNGITRARDIAEAPNGQPITGRADDVQFLQVQKHADFAVAADQSAKIERGVGQAFLMATSIQRDGERVTAEEIRRMAQELEVGLGGTYSILSLEYQMPLVVLTMHAMQRQKRLPPLPKQVKPTILTGIQALGRNSDLERLMTFFNVIAKLPIPQEETMMSVVASEAYTRVATALDLELRGLIRSDEEIQQQKAEQQQIAAQQQMAMAVAPQMAQAAMGQPEQGMPEEGV